MDTNLNNITNNSVFLAIAEIETSQNSGNALPPEKAAKTSTKCTYTTLIRIDRVSATETRIGLPLLGDVLEYDDTTKVQPPHTFGMKRVPKSTRFLLAQYLSWNDFVGECSFDPNVTITHLAEAGEPVMETTKHIKMSITQGQTVILPCMISFQHVDEKDRRKYSVIWTTKEGRVLTINERVQTNHRKFELSHPYPNEWNLKVIRVRNTDSGEYKCQVNSDPVQTKTVVLIVHDAPTVHLSTNRISQYRYKSIVLDCNVIANPTETVTWYKNGKTLRTNWKYKLEDFEQSDGSRTHSLDIGYLERLDFGDYVCMAINKVGTASEVVTVTEITTSTIISKPDSTTIKSDKEKMSTVTTPVKTSSTRTSVSSTSESVHYIPDNSPRNGELVVVPDNAAVVPSCKNTLLFFIITLVSLCI